MIKLIRISLRTVRSAERGGGAEGVTVRGRGVQNCQV